ncbi:hypothetical protein [Sporolactobacillus shoreae]|uniref:hypothetical protein n=1 Tax=Sporolactobacillus shoreae TaxID=1465501 RepID=UPI001F4F30B7|nr:hypothetical protein [Sporolactobacillus shoreae]
MSINDNRNFFRKLILTLWSNRFVVFLSLYSFFIMLFFTQSSPFFALNNWDDANAFFTVGKGMAHGLVPYKDLFEQKGPLLYAIYELAYLIWHTSFFGVYLLESLAMFFSLFLAHKIAQLYLHRMSSALVSLFFPILILNQPAFYFGGSAEEFAIPFLMLFLYLVLNHFKLSHDKPFSYRFYITIGLIAGCLLWIKFTFLGGCIGFYIALFVILAGKRKWKELLQALAFTTIGLILSSMPWLIYFGVNHALVDLFNVYFKFNLSTYSSQLTIPDKLINSALAIGATLNKNVESKIMFLIGMADFLLTWKYFRSSAEKWILFSITVGLLLGVYIGGREYVYYFLIVTPLTLFGLIAIGLFLQKSKQLMPYEKNKKGRWLVLLFFSMVTIYLCFGYNTNIQYSRFLEKKIPVQKKFAAIIDRQKTPTLLNYGFLDGGFYLAANIVPNVRYFEKQNIDHKLYPENMNAQNQYIREGKTEFVVIRLERHLNSERINIQGIQKTYHVIAKQVQKLNGRPILYILLQKNVK